MTEPAPLQYPQLFQGVFARRRECFTPIVEEARRVMHELRVPEPLRPFYDTVVRDNPQPSFLLLPLMFLKMAEDSGGIQAAHRRFLPVFMLCLEACAIVDDTVDRTPMRSGRLSVPMRLGEANTAPFVSSLVALVARESARVDLRLFEATMHLFIEMHALQLWEGHNTYPPEELFGQWLQNRYRQNTFGVSFGLDTALLLSGHEPLPTRVHETFGQIFQDVDDLVNILEDRNAEGENDDLLMGTVTRPLLLTLEKYPSLRADVAALWRDCQAMADVSLAEMRRVPTHTRAAIEKLARPIREAILEVGVQGTIENVLSNYRTCVLSTPPELRSSIREMTGTWVDRLRRCQGAESVTEEQLRLVLEDTALVAA